MPVRYLLSPLHFPLWSHGVQRMKILRFSAPRLSPRKYAAAATLSSTLTARFKGHHPIHTSTAFIRMFFIHRDPLPSLEYKPRRQTSSIRARIRTSALAARNISCSGSNRTHSSIAAEDSKEDDIRRSEETPLLINYLQSLTILPPLNTNNFCQRHQY